MGTTHIREVLPAPELTNSEPNREREGCVAYLYLSGVLVNFNNCQQWASEMNVWEEKAMADQEKVKKDLHKLKCLQEQLQQDQVNVSAVSQQE
jgi:hypothetical protein